MSNVWEQAVEALAGIARDCERGATEMGMSPAGVTDIVARVRAVLAEMERWTPVGGCAAKCLPNTWEFCEAPYPMLEDDRPALLLVQKEEP